MNTLKMLKSLTTLALLVLCCWGPLMAQTDVSKKLRKLPKQDGTHLFHEEHDFNFFAVKQDGKIVEILVKDKQGNVVPQEEEKPSSTTRLASGSSGAGTTRPKTTAPGPCPSGPDQICRWNTTFKSCICIYTGPLN